MFGYIDGVDFSTIEPEKYWSFPATFQRNKTEIRKLIMSDRYYGAEKRKDGYYEDSLRMKMGT